MKFLLFSDIHCDEDACRAVVAKATQADVAIGAGDYALFRDGLQHTIDLLSQITIPTILVPGNHESYDELVAACCNWKSVHVLHDNVVQVNGVIFFGLGYATPITPFDSWSMDISEDVAEECLALCPSNSILISHSPPKDCLDSISTSRKIGSQSVRRCIENIDLQFVVCGHIHEEFNKCEYIGGTPVINAGPFGKIYHLPIQKG